MPRFENLIFFLALAVMCMLVVIQLHWNFESAEPVDTQQSHQVRELNNTLYALNAALKDMLKDAKKRRKFPDEDIFPPETLKTNLRHGKESGLSNGLVGITTPNPIRVEVNGSSLAVVNELIPKRHKKAVIFTMDSISQCEFLFYDIEFHFIYVCAHSDEENSKLGGAAGCGVHQGKVL